MIITVRNVGKVKGGWRKFTADSGDVYSLPPGKTDILKGENYDIRFRDNNYNRRRIVWYIHPVKWTSLSFA